jgi:hypothetical protein
MFEIVVGSKVLADGYTTYHEAYRTAEELRLVLGYRDATVRQVPSEFSRRSNLSGFQWDDYTAYYRD